VIHFSYINAVRIICTTAHHEARTACEVGKHYERVGLTETVCPLQIFSTAEIKTTISVHTCEVLTDLFECFGTYNN
jgi:hypothetical protein